MASITGITKAIERLLKSFQEEYFHIKANVSNFLYGIIDFLCIVMIITCNLRSKRRASLKTLKKARFYLHIPLLTMSLIFILHILCIIHIQTNIYLTGCLVLIVWSGNSIEKILKRRNVKHFIKLDFLSVQQKIRSLAHLISDRLSYLWLSLSKYSAGLRSCLQSTLQINRILLVMTTCNLNIKRYFNEKIMEKINFSLYIPFCTTRLIFIPYIWAIIKLRTSMYLSNMICLENSMDILLKMNKKNYFIGSDFQGIQQKKHSFIQKILVRISDLRLQLKEYLIEYQNCIWSVSKTNRILFEG